MFRPSFVVKLSEEHRHWLISDTYIHCYGAPSSDKWGKRYEHGGLVSQIRNKLRMGPGLNNTVRNAMQKTYGELLQLQLHTKDGESIVLNDDINLNRSSHDYSLLMKIPSGSKYETMVCIYVCMYVCRGSFAI